MKYEGQLTADSWFQLSISQKSEEKRIQYLLDTLYWAVAANNREAVVNTATNVQNKKLMQEENEKLRRLAKLFKRHKICSAWGDVSSLQSLAWEEVRQSSPALVTLPHFIIVQKK